MVVKPAHSIQKNKISRRNMIRLGFTLPATATLFWASTPQAGAGGPTEPVIEIIDAVSNTIADRSKLVPGNYRPDARTTGPLPGTNLSRIDGDFNATSNRQVIENLEILGSINVKTFSNVVIRNCIIRGSTALNSDTACVVFANDNGRGLLIEDCKIAGRDNHWLAGMRGGNYTIRRTEISNTTDGVALTSTLGNVTIEACWIHNGYYVEWEPNTQNYRNSGNYYVHTDGIQFHRGRNYLIRGNMIGGTRYVADHHTGLQNQIQAADDMYNSALMIKQEVDDSEANKIENVLIEKNWLMGGQATVNITTGRNNNFSTLSFKDNRFIRSTWGAQTYILRGSGLGQFSNNVFDDDGSSVPISKGY